MEKGKVTSELPQDIHECKTIEEILEWSYQNMRPIYGITPETVRLVFEEIPRAAASEQAVLVIGKTGTGKELVVQEIVKKSKIDQKKYVAVNCAAISESLMDSELFGHVKGAFTGADKSKNGYLKMADGGAIFLDEIGEIPSYIQAKLLRVVETGEFYPVGGDKLERVKVRLFAATNKPKKIRKDLQYRFPIRIELTPLLHRRPDVYAILYGMLKDKYPNGKEGKNVVWALPPWTFVALLFSPFEGNVREIRGDAQNSIDEVEWAKEKLTEKSEKAIILFEHIIPHKISPYFHDVENLRGIWKYILGIFFNRNREFEKDQFYEFTDYYKYNKLEYIACELAHGLRICLECYEARMKRYGKPFHPNYSLAQKIETAFLDQLFLLDEMDPKLLHGIEQEYERLGLEHPWLKTQKSPSDHKSDQPIGDLTGLTQDELLDCYYMQMLDKGWSQKRIAQAAGKSESAISDRMRKIKENSKNRI